MQSFQGIFVAGHSKVQANWWSMDSLWCSMADLRTFAIFGEWRSIS